MSQQEFVSVPVPVDRVQEVYELLARQPRPGTAGHDEQVAARDAALIDRAYGGSGWRMQAAIEYLAAHAGAEVPMTELAIAVEKSNPAPKTPQPSPKELAKSMSGAMSAFSRRWRNRYHEGRDVPQPFGRHWDFERRMMVYSMEPEVAEAITRAAEQAR